jgi:hypothetical protein
MRGEGMVRWLRTGCLLLASSFASTAVGQTTQQFDVVCAVEERWRSQTPRSGGASSGLYQKSYRFRVDLVGQKFCVDHCKAFFDLTDPSNGSSLDLTYRPMIEASDVPYDHDRHVTLNRVSGVISTYYDTGTFTARGAGQCRREPFSGFPEVMF